jgi:predicted phosphoribosyltransferase
MRYADRRAAGRELADALMRRHLGRDVVVMALPRGGVPVAYEVALALRAPLDVLIVRKIGCPWNPELALGALASGDIVVENPDVLQFIDRGALSGAVEEQRRELTRREQAYRKDLPALSVAGRTVIVIDDGAATGATMLAAVRSLHARETAKVIVALPVASAEAVDRMQREDAEVICISVPEWFEAVGRWYEKFPQVDDEEVTSLLANARAQYLGHAAAPT